MRRILQSRTLACAALLSALTACCAYAGSPDMQEFTQIERGRYLSILSDCAGCHTVPGGRPFSGGRAIETPFGNIVSPNVTPDLETGIGAWSDDQFDAAVRKGIGRTGAHLYPAMPYTAYTRLSRDDVMAIRAYLELAGAGSELAQCKYASVPVQYPLGDDCVERTLLHGG